MTQEMKEAPLSGAIQNLFGAGDENVRLLEQLLDVRVALRGGEILGIFPEGTRHHEGVMREMETGVAMLALRSGAPVIPVLVPRLRWFHTVDCYVGEAIPTSDLREQGINTQTCQTLMERITACYAALMKHKGIEYAES